MNLNVRVLLFNKFIDYTYSSYIFDNINNFHTKDFIDSYNVIICFL